MNALEREISALHADLSEAETEIATLRSRLATAESERNQLSEQVVVGREAFQRMREQLTAERDTALAALAAAMTVVEAAGDALDKALCICGAQPDTGALFGLWKAARNVAASVEAFRSRTKESADV